MNQQLSDNQIVDRHGRRDLETAELADFKKQLVQDSYFWRYMRSRKDRMEKEILAQARGGSTSGEQYARTCGAYDEVCRMLQQLEP